MTKKEFLSTVQEAKNLLAQISEETLPVIAQNLGYCEESPQMASLGKHDALSAVVELKNQAASLQKLILNLQSHELE